MNKTNVMAGLKKKKRTKQVWEGRDFIGTNTLKKVQYQNIYRYDRGED